MAKKKNEAEPEFFDTRDIAAGLHDDAINASLRPQDEGLPCRVKYPKPTQVAGSEPTQVYPGTYYPSRDVAEFRTGRNKSIVGPNLATITLIDFYPTKEG